MRTATAGGIAGLAGAVVSVIAATPARLGTVLVATVVVAVVLVAAALTAVLVSDRAAERAALLIATLRGQRTVPRLPRRPGTATNGHAASGRR